MNANFTERLLEITEGCRADMHEPDEQDVSAHVLGNLLDNARGETVCAHDIVSGHQELIVVISREGKQESFNLATLIALARIGAREEFVYCDGCSGYECSPEKGCAYPGVAHPRLSRQTSGGSVPKRF